MTSGNIEAASLPVSKPTFGPHCSNSLCQGAGCSSCGACILQSSCCCFPLKCVKSAGELCLSCLTQLCLLAGCSCCGASFIQSSCCCFPSCSGHTSCLRTAPSFHPSFLLFLTFTCRPTVMLQAPRNKPRVLLLLSQVIIDQFLHMMFVLTAACICTYLSETQP